MIVTTQRIEAVTTHAKAVIKDGRVESIVLHGHLKRGDVAEGERYHLRFDSLQELKAALKDFQEVAGWIESSLQMHHRHQSHEVPGE